MTYTDGKMLIDGQLVDADSRERFDSVNPATEESAGTAPEAGTAEMQRAIAAARHAADKTDWSRDRELRKHCLAQIQQRCRDYADTWRHELVAEVGTPVMWTHAFQLDWPIEFGLGTPLKLMDTYEWEIDRGIIDTPPRKSQRTVIKHPVGVVGAIVPWNFPMEIMLSKVGPIIATGNTAVFKPAPDTPLSALRLAELIAATDLPAGVINIVTSSDHQVGETLASSPDVDLVAFTGSTMTGKRVMEVAAHNVTKVFLELGGKSANIVLDDADFSSVLAGTVQTCIHAGQGCALPTRLLIPRRRYDEAVDQLEAVWSQIPYGDPTDPTVMAGPLISSKQRERVLGYLDLGKQEGARALVGGGTPAHLERGYYVEPTLFVDVDNTMRIAQEEIFGPVLVVIPYDDDDDAVRIANDTIYGLAGAVHSSDVARAEAVARRLRAGSISVNGAGAYLCDVPFGGFKHSGIGRQWGPEGFDEMMEFTSLSLPVPSSTADHADHG